MGERTIRPMPPAYDLIVQRQGELQIETVQVANVRDAWRLGRQRYPNGIRAVVRCDGDAAEPGMRR